MQLKQANLVLGVSMAIVGLIVIVSGVMVFMSFQDAATTRDDRDSKFSSFRKICLQDPFPNQENIDRMADNVGVVSNWYETLLGTLGAGLSFPAAENASIFGSRREQVITGLRDAAPVGLKGEKVVPADFMFGFEAYREGKTAKLDEVPRLLYQLDLVDAIVREMYAAKVLSISVVQREVFEASAGEAVAAEEEETSSRRSRKRGKGRRSSSDEDGSGTSASADASADSNGDLIDFPLPVNRQKFTFEFLAKEESLVDLLNRLASMPRYVAVTGLEFSKTGSDFFERKSEEEQGGRSGKRSLRFGKDAEAPAEAPAPVSNEPVSRLARSFTGKNLESPIAVKMSVEVYAVRVEGAPAGEEEPAPAEEEAAPAEEGEED